MPLNDRIAATPMKEKRTPLGYYQRAAVKNHSQDENPFFMSLSRKLLSCEFERVVSAPTTVDEVDYDLIRMGDTYWRLSCCQIRRCQCLGEIC